MVQMDSPYMISYKCLILINMFISDHLGVTGAGKFGSSLISRTKFQTPPPPPPNPGAISLKM